MKIAIIQRRPFPGQHSVEGYFQSISICLRQMGHAVEQFELPFHSQGIIPRLRNARSVKSIEADVFHVAGDVHYVSLACPQQKTILTVLDCEPLERLRGLRRLLLKVLWFELPARRSALVTVISEETKRQLLRHLPSLPENKVLVVPVCVSDRFKEFAKDFNAKCPRILQVGTKPNKNVARLVRALEGIECKLVIVGKMDQELQSTIAETKIDVENKVGLSDEEIYNEYKRSDIVAFPSLYEGFGMPIIEAQSVGRPVLTSRISSLPEVAGKGACLVDPYNISDIRNGIQRLICDHEYRTSIVNSGRVNSKKYHGPQIANMFENVYRRLGTIGRERPLVERKS